MRAMILGAGIGSRLDPLTRSLPKPLVPIVGKPVMGHLIDLLRRHGITEIMVNVQYLGHKIRETIGDGSDYGVPVRYSVEEELCGDAGGVKRVEAFFREGGAAGDTFLVIGGDDLTDTDIGRVVRAHKEKNATATLAVTPVDDPSEYGIVVQSEDGFITRFQEKPKPGEAFSNLANTGIYVFHTKVFDFIPANTFFGFGNNVFPALMQAGEPMLAVASDAYWKDVGNLAIYRQAQRDCMDGKVQVDFTGRTLLAPGGDGSPEAVVSASGEPLRYAPPVVIGKNCRVAGSAFLGEYTVLGDDCVVEEGATVLNSVLWNGAVVEAGSYLENCVVGEGVRVRTTHGIFNGLIVEPKRPG